jgi:hypothetical protein
MLNQYNHTDDDLNEAEELYAQLRAQGYTKTEAAKNAWPKQLYPKQYGHLAEKNRQRIQDRIQELKEERAEESGLDVQEQIRRYNDLYRALKLEGKWSQAAKILERLDAIGGFDAPTKSVSLSAKIGGNLRDSQGDLSKDIQKFARVLNPHVPQVTVDSTNKMVTIDVPKGEYKEEVIVTGEVVKH